jgi:uncharacterized protein (DUF302 family)
LVTVNSQAGPVETAERLVAVITVFARIDHAAAAAAVGLPLRPTQLVVFGSARGGTPLMQAQQLMGFDLPLRALVWQDEALQTWVSYPDMTWLARRYGLPPATEQAIGNITGRLQARRRSPLGCPRTMSWMRSWMSHFRQATRCPGATTQSNCAPSCLWARRPPLLSLRARLYGFAGWQACVDSLR